MWLGAMAVDPPHHHDHGLGNLLVSRHRELGPGAAAVRAGHHGGQEPPHLSFLFPKRENGAGVGWERVEAFDARQGLVAVLVLSMKAWEGPFLLPLLGLSFPSEFEKGGSERSFFEMSIARCTRPGWKMF